MIFIAVAGFGAAGCKSGSDYYGTGPLVLSAKAEGAIQKYRYGRDAVRENLHIAVDRRLRSYGATYCPAKELSKCLGESNAPQRAVNHCTKDGQYDCGLYSIDRRIVWQGPIYIRHPATGQTVPYHGVWPVETDWAPAADGARLVGHEGELRVEGLAGGGACPVTITPTSNSTGRFSVRCGAGELRGDYSGVGTRGVIGTARDGEGRKVRFEVDLKTGRGAPAA
ncbi:MAG: hypothetical protein TEF_16765 [Rhizobiales bacterium NRL2]|jgi:hypothetical protein|nr:MAG: hypothetical protein TEF_16765 [Rhizobiales bacterium NRL2]